MSNFVFVIDTDHKPLNPCKPGVARSLLDNGKAAVFRRYPFTIILKKAVDTVPDPLVLKIDPGSKTTGFAILNNHQVIFAAELTHRGQAIKATLESRRSFKPEVLKRILAQAKRPLKDAAAVNATRWALFQALKETGLEVSTGSGGLTKFNRVRLGLPKTHWLDAACVGDTPALEVLTTQPLLIKATGHGSRQMCRTDQFGFPSRYVPRFKVVQGFQTGDIVKAIVTTGKKIGEYVGRVAVRTKGSFNISDKSGLIDSVAHRFCQIIHKKDGYGYEV
jgi:hypothetical protein